MAQEKKTAGKPEGTVMFRNWWAVLLRGLIMLALGIILLAWPDKTVTVVLRIFGIVILAYGIVILIQALMARSREGEPFTVPLVGSIVAMAAGVITLAWPSATGLVVLYIVAIWAIVTGVIEIVAAFTFPVRDWPVWVLGLGGLISIVIGILLISFPSSGVVGLAWLIGIYALVVGALLSVVGIKMRSIKVVVEA
ncbi:MAG: DUF308 domain-containing protein [Actinobacteria bacterium]|nr:DUF308 domain-containing protein [Actinomycetota bacterium]MBU1944193.1 DUF308 domain-containing protein [Actinomycetota bacterium]MBU2688682.1 DUF308 domain-containing protein [Actinomycetota bacterium]